MSEDTAVKVMTSEEFFALPDDDDVERWLIDGELRERPMTKRNPDHSSAMVNIGALLWAWVRAQPKPRGRVYSGEVYFRLRRNPDTNVGIDVAYASDELAARTPRGVKFVDGPPVLAVEILFPHDTDDDLNRKIRSYLDSGVKLVWLIDPFLSSVTVCRSDALPQMFNAEQELSGESYLPGFRVSVAEIFDD
jgi:Uma2 family endonuclease